MRFGQQLLAVSWVFLLLTFLHTPAFPQAAEAYNPTFEIFELPGGRPNNQVQQVIQDSSGYLWFASVGGLHRWDGHNFKSYTHDPEDPTSLSFDYVERLFIDSKGGLWVGTNGGGLNYFDTYNETFTRYQADSTNLRGISGNIVNAISEDTEGNIWVATRGGLNKWDPRTQLFTQYVYDRNDSTGISGPWIWELAPGEKGEMWVGVSYLGGGKPGLNRYIPETNSFVHYLHRPGDERTPARSDHIAAFLTDSKGNFWIPSGPILEQFDPKTEIFSSYATYATSTDHNPSFDGSWISSLMESQSGKIWIGSYQNGLQRYDPETGKVDRFTADSEKEGSIATNWIWNLFQSQDGTIWVLSGTQGAVMRIRPPEPSPQYLVNAFPIKDYDTSEDPFTVIFMDSVENLWLSTSNDGLMQYHPERGMVQQLYASSSRSQKYRLQPIGMDL